MNAWHCPRKLIVLQRAVLLAMVLGCLALVQPLPLRASNTGQVSVTRISFEGYITEKSAGQWVISNTTSTTVTVDGSTHIDASRGAANLFAWVEVVATHRDGQALHADSVSVLRPAGEAGTKAQFSGPLQKISPDQTEWQVANQLFLVDAHTVGAKNAQVGDFLSVIAEQRQGVYYALLIANLAQRSTAAPVEFVGIVGPIPINQAYWLIGGSRVYYASSTVRRNGEPKEGDIVEVRAQQDSNGQLHADIVNVKDPAATQSLSVQVRAIYILPDDAADWDVLVVRYPIAGEPHPGTLHITKRTYIEPAGGQVAPGQWADVRAVLNADGSYQAEIVRLQRPAVAAQARGMARPALPTGAGPVDWTPPIPITEHQEAARSPNLVFTSDGVAHAVWEMLGELWYSQRPPDGAWRRPERIAYGIMPSLAVRKDDSLHLVYSYNFMGNDEIYYITRQSDGWSLPVNVSHTDKGHSYAPALAITPDGMLHVAWADQPADGAPEWVVFLGSLANNFWTSLPVPSGRGESPALASDRDGSLYLAWQRRPTDGCATLYSTDVYVTRLQGVDWTLPVNVSDSGCSNSSDATIVTAADGLAHVAWVEDGNGVYYAHGRDFAWSVPQFIARGTVNTVEPRLATDRDMTLVLAWVQDQTIRAGDALVSTGVWRTPATVVAPPPDGGLWDVALSSKPSGGVSLGWVQISAQGAGDIAVYESSRASAVAAQIWIPLLTRNP